jgi:hypothetical protein
MNSSPLYANARRARRGLAAVLLAAVASPAFAQPSEQPDWIARLSASYETWQATAAGPLADHQLVELSASEPWRVLALGQLPADADVDALERLTTGEVWFSLADWAELPGGVRAHPADVLQWNGSAYVKVYDAVACLGPQSLNVDALDVQVDGTGGSYLLLSFDTNATFLAALFQIVRVFDEEMIILTAPFSCTFGLKITFPGLARQLDLDAIAAVPRWSHEGDPVHYASFDTWASVGGVTGGPGDLLGYWPRRSEWSLGKLSLTPQGGPPPPSGDLDAAWVLPAGIFEDGFEIGSTGRWSATFN